MMPWSKIVISAEDQTGPAFNSARNNVKGFSGDVAASTTQLQSWGQALLGGITVGAVAGKLVAVQREFDVLNSSLITVTGSSAAAEREMAWIKQFAKETPFGLAQATDGFVKMKALGLEPTRASLTSFGNTAAAMGKDLKQMIEAVADASTGEFERLKEFGIKARKEGDSVSLTFQGVTTTVRNSAEEITKYLEGIGNNQFGGAMAERAKTLDGAIAELGDTWDELFRTVNQNATGTLIADTVRMATAAVSDLTEVLGAMTRGADDSARATGALTTIQNGLGTVFETVAALGLNVKYVLVQIGNELGGLAAQAAAVATLQFSQAAEIGRMMKEDAAAARAQVDAGTARILNARQDANNRGSTLAGSANAGLDKYLAGMTTPPRPTRPASGGGGGGGGGGRAARPRAQTERESEEARAYAQAMEAIAKAQMTAAIAGENYTTTQQRLVDIMTSPEWRNMPEEWRLVIAQQGEAAILAEQHAAAQKKANDARKAEAEAATRELESLQSGNAQMREQIDMLGLTTAEQTAYTQALNESAIAKLEDKAASLEMLDADSAIAKQLREQVAALKDRNALLGRKAEKEQMLEAQRAQLDMWKSIDQTAHDVFVNIFEDGAGTFKRLGQTLKAAVLDMLYQMTVKRWIIQIGVSFTGQPLSVVSQALGGGQGGAGNLLGTASNANSAINSASLIGNWLGFGSGAAPGTLALANAWGAMGGNSMSAFIAANGGWGTIAGAGGAAGGAGAVLSAIPGWGWALGGTLALFGDKLFGRKLKDYGIEGEFGGEAGFEGRNYQFYKGGLFRSDKTRYSELEEQYRTTLARPFIAARDLISSYARTLALDANELDDYRSKFKLSIKDKKEDEINQAIAQAIATASNEMAQQIIGSWQVVTDGANSKLGRRVYVQSEYAREGEKAIDTLTRLATSLQNVNSAFDTLGHTLLTASLASGDLASRLIDAAGGQEAFGNQTQSYWQNYYTEEERAATIRRQIAEQLGNAGVAMPDTRAAWRALVEETQTRLAAGDESAITLFATLMRLSDAFASITPSLDDVARAAADTADRLAEEARRLAEENYNNARSATDDAFSALEKFIGSQRDMWQTALDAANALIGEASTIRDTAGNAARDLWGQADDTRAMLAMQGNAAIDQMLGALRTTGALPDADALGNAIAGARGGLDMAGYARSADQEFAQKVLAGKLGEMGELADGQLSIAEQQADYAKQQIKQLDDTLDYWRKQLDLMRNTDLTVTSIADGIGKLVAAMEEERAAQAALDAARNTPAPSTGNPANAGWAIGGSSGSSGGSGGAYLDYTDFTRHYADGSSALLNMNEVWMALWNSSGGDRAAAEAAYAAEEERRRREGIPSYAVGSDYVPRDMLANVHQGEIIVPAVPAAIIRNLVSNSGDSGSAELLAEVRALRDEVAGLRAEQREPAAATVRLANQFNNVSEGGNALRTEVMA